MAAIHGFGQDRAKIDAELAALEEDWQSRRRWQALEQGATLIDPESVWFSADTELGRDCTIEPHVVFGPGVNQNPAGNGGIGGVGTGFAQTTALEAGGRAVNSTSLSGNGTLTGTVNNRTESGALNPQQGQFNTSTLTGNGTLNGSFERTASSYANTGLNGYSGSQMTGGPGTVSNQVSGSAFGVGASLSGGASLSR